MLVLSRKVGQVVIIGQGANQVRVVIADIRGDKVRIGLEAAASVPIHREEVWVAIQRDMLAELDPPIVVRIAE